MERNEVIVVLIIVIGILLAIGGALLVGTLANNNDHDFDRVCLQSGNLIQYQPVAGRSTPQKVCVK